MAVKVPQVGEMKRNPHCAVILAEYVHMFVVSRKIAQLLFFPMARGVHCPEPFTWGGWEGTVHNSSPFPATTAEI